MRWIESEKTSQIVNDLTLSLRRHGYEVMKADDLKELKAELKKVRRDAYGYRRKLGHSVASECSFFGVSTWMGSGPKAVQVHYSWYKGCPRIKIYRTPGPDREMVFDSYFHEDGAKEVTE